MPPLAMASLDDPGYQYYFAKGNPAARGSQLYLELSMPLSTLLGAA